MAWQGTHQRALYAKEAINRGCVRGAAYMGDHQQLDNFVHGRDYLRGPRARRGVISVYLELAAHCGGDRDKYTFLDEPDGKTLISVTLGTFAFLLSNVCLMWEGMCRAFTDGIGVCDVSVMYMFFEGLQSCILLVC